VRDLETSRMGAPYIYDISRLKVNCVVFFTKHEVSMKTGTNRIKSERGKGLNWGTKQRSFVRNSKTKTNTVHNM